MEIEVKIIKLNDKKEISFKIPKKEMTGIIGKDSNKIIDILSGNIKKINCEIFYDKKKITNTNKYEIKKRISYIPSMPNINTNLTTIEEYMIYIISQKKLQIKDPIKKIIDSLKIVGLPPQYIRKNIHQISSSEQKLLQIAISLLKNPKLVILDEPFIEFDYKNIKKLIRLLTQLNDKCDITIIIKTNNSEILYKYIKHIIIFNNNKIIAQGNTKDIYNNVKLLIKNNIEIPEIVDFVYKAKIKKNIMIDYHRDIRDLIKDIYKHI